MVSKTSLPDHTQLLPENSIELARYFELLADHGARGDSPDPEGRTATQILARKRHPAYRALVERFIPRVG